jgi:hypothetical protein
MTVSDMINDGLGLSKSDIEKMMELAIPTLARVGFLDSFRSVSGWRRIARAVSLWEGGRRRWVTNSIKFRLESVPRNLIELCRCISNSC